MFGVTSNHLLNTLAVNSDAARPTPTVTRNPMAAYHAYEMR